MPVATLDPKALPRAQKERRQIAIELQNEAKAAHAREDLVRATRLAADLLMLYPNERAYLDVFDAIVLASPDPLALLPGEPHELSVATAAARARILMMQRRLPEALELLADAVRAAPELPYLHWAARWLQPEIVRSLSWDLLFETVVKPALTITIGVAVPPPEDDPRIANLRAAASLFASLRECHPRESILWYGETLIRRRLDEPNETLSMAEAASARFPKDWRIRTALLNAYRDAGRPDDALAQARAALELDPSDPSPLYDAAWAYVESQRHDSAAHIFAECVEHDPDSPGVRAAMHYARWLARRAPEDERALIELRDRRPWDEEARRLADEVEPSRPYVNVLPPPADPSAEEARAFVAELARVIDRAGAEPRYDVVVRARHLDSPSVAVAFRLALTELGTQGSLRFEPEIIPSPDPRTDKAPVSTPIWRYEGALPTPVHPLGDRRAQEAIANIARTLYRRREWDAAAKRVADQFGYGGYHALLSVLTHPPAPAEGFDAFAWTWRCQVATALALSHLGPWESGSARAALYSMVYGPSDWITAAALIAFGARVDERPELRGEVETLFRWLRTQVPRQGFTAWEVVLAEVWRGLGAHDSALETELEAWIARASLPERNPVEPVPRKYAGLTLEEYARFALERDRILAAPGPGSESPELAELCLRYGVPVARPSIEAWRAAMDATPALRERVLEVQRALAVDERPLGTMELPKAQASVRPKQASAEDDDPTVFPGQPVAKLSDYVEMLESLRRGDIMGTLKRYGLDVESYARVARAWFDRLAADPALNEKFERRLLA